MTEPQAGVVLDDDKVRMEFVVTGGESRRRAPALSPEEMVDERSETSGAER